MTTEPRPEVGDVDTDALLAAAGIEVTPEGKARWRERLAEARKTSPDRNAAIRRQLGLEDRPRRTA